MAFINPFQLIVFPFVFVIALPLALFAGLTTMLAFLVLFLRLFMVYFDVVLEALRHIVLGRSLLSVPARQARRESPLSMLASPSSSTSSLVASADQSSTPQAASMSGSHHHPRRNRRPSTSSSNFGNGGSGAMTPVSTGGGIANLEGLSASAQSLGLERDFEGVGGWRLDSLSNDVDTASDQQWFNLNARLQIPDRGGGGNNGNTRHHFRSHSGGPVLAGSGDSIGWYPSGGTAGGVGMHGGGNGAAPLNGNGNRFVPPSPEGLRMTASPNSSRSRSRTPTASKPQSFAKVNEDGYFPPYDTKPLRRMCV